MNIDSETEAYVERVMEECKLEPVWKVLIRELVRNSFKDGFRAGMKHSEAATIAKE